MFLSREEAFGLLSQFGSPLYVYSEDILRARCRELREAFCGRIHPSFSIKANSNAALLRMIREEGIGADAVSCGEIFILEYAGFDSSEIFFIPNNASEKELCFAAERDILISADSLSQLEAIGRVNRGGRVALRINPGIGAGHCDKVVTAGHATKFGIDPALCCEAKKIIKAFDLKLTGVNQHIGSLFLEPGPYVKAAEALLAIVLEHFPGLEFIDFGGGFGVPYKKNEQRLDLAALRDGLFPLMDSFTAHYDNKDVSFKCEPGRYIAAECGILLGTVNAVKECFGRRYVGTDLGFNVLMRPVLYDSWHEVQLIKKEEDGGCASASLADVTGNICESGDIIAASRPVGNAVRGDIIAVENAGAYGYSMASTYNSRLRPAEVLKTKDGKFRLIRAADTLQSLTASF